MTITYMYMCIYTLVHVTCVYACMHVHVHVYMHVCMYMYMYINMYNYTCTINMFIYIDTLYQERMDCTCNHTVHKGSKTCHKVYNVYRNYCNV